MRLRKPGSKPSRGVAAARGAGVPQAVRGVGEELVAIGREMLRIPAGLYMRVAEAAGRATLAAFLFVWPFLVAGWALTVRLFRVAEREVTPLRAALAVAAVAALALVLSQFADYRSVAISTADYTGVDQIVEAPPVETDKGGSAHAWLGLPLALATLAVTAACAAGRRVALWLVPIGLAVVALSVFVDAPKGLDEGAVAVAYEGAKATLLGGFWVQLACGALLVALGPLISNLMPPSGDVAAATSRRRRLPWTRVPA